MLNSWEEIVGNFKGLITNDHSVTIKIGEARLMFSKNSLEASYIRTQLDDHMIGRKIAILQTDLPYKPILLRFLWAGNNEGR